MISEDPGEMISEMRSTMPWGISTRSSAALAGAKSGEGELGSVHGHQGATYHLAKLTAVHGYCAPAKIGTVIRVAEPV